MENKVLEENIDRIKQYDKKLADLILINDDKKSNLSLAQTNKGEYNILLNGIPLHSQEGAIEESKKITSLLQDKEDAGAVRIVYGFGMGYLVDELSNVVKGRIIVYEPDINLLRFILSIARVDAVFKNNVAICADKNTFSKHIASFAKSDSKMTINILPSYRMLYEKDIQEIMKLAQRAQGEIKASENTFAKSAPNAIKNTFANLKYIFQNPCISDIKDIYKGKTALCLSAGPSLRKNIEVIKKNREKCIIFAVNPTLKLLKEYDILPDFIVAIESVDMGHQIKNVKSEECYMIVDGFSNTNLYETKTAKTINYISTGNFLNNWLKDCLQLKDNLISQGTVSYTAFMSACVMGFDKIILCGQDLAYSDGQCYAKGSQFEELECVYDKEKQKYVIIARDFEEYAKSFVNERVKIELARSAAEYNLKFLNNNLYTVKDQFGNDVPTQTGYAIFIDWFSRASEDIKEQKPNIRLINSSTGGAQIDGFENISIEEALEGGETVERKDLSKVVHIYDKKYASDKVNLMYKYLDEFKSDLVLFNDVNNKTLREIENKKILTPNLIKLLQKHEDLLYKVFDYKNNNEIKNALLIYLSKYVSVVDKDYYTDLDLCQKTLKEIIAITDEILENTKLFLEGLADCKPFIS